MNLEKYMTYEPRFEGRCKVFALLLTGLVSKRDGDGLLPGELLPMLIRLIGFPGPDQRFYDGVWTLWAMQRDGHFTYARRVCDLTPEDSMVVRTVALKRANKYKQSVRLYKRLGGRVRERERRPLPPRKDARPPLIPNPIVLLGDLLNNYHT